MEALWVYQNLNRTEPGLLRSVLRAADPNARAAATAVLRDWHGAMPDALHLLAAQVADEHPRVRLQAVIELSYIPTRRSMELAAAALERPTDRYIEQALRNTANALKPHWEPHLAAGEMLFDGNPVKLEFVTQAAGSVPGARVLVRLLNGGKVEPSRRAKVLGTIASVGGEQELKALFEHAFENEFQARVLSELARAARDRKIIPKTDFQRLKTHLNSSHEPLRIAALQLAGAWKAGDLRAYIASAAQAKGSAKVRQAAIESLAAIGGAESVSILRSFTSQKNETSIRMAALASLADIDLAAASAVAAAMMGEEAVEVAPVFKPFLQRHGGADALGKAFDGQRILPDNAKLALRLMQSAGRQDQPLLGLLYEAAGLNAETPELSREQLVQLAETVRQKGDAARGELIYRRSELSCVQCHAIAGAGGQVGPDLSAVGSGSTLEYLIESLLFPNKIIKDGFETIEVVTQDDDYVLGVRVRENRKELVLKDATRSSIVIPANRIKERHDKPASLMPAGLVNSLTQAELLDLCKFLSELGKPGLFANNPKPVMRAWSLAPATESVSPTDESTLSWTSAFSLVSGMLPLDELVAAGKNGVVLARSRMEVTTPGKIQLKLNSTEGLAAWVNGKPTALGPQVVLDLERGVNTIIFKLNIKQRKTGLLVEVEDVPGSPGRFQLLGQ